MMVRVSLLKFLYCLVCLLAFSLGSAEEVMPQCFINVVNSPREVTVVKPFRPFETIQIQYTIIVGDCDVIQCGVMEYQASWLVDPGFGATIIGPSPPKSGVICKGERDYTTVTVRLTNDIPNGTWVLQFTTRGFSEGDLVNTFITVTGSEVPLEATATASPTSGDAPLTVSFTGSATGGNPPYGFSWDFGDGTTSTEQNPAHTYTLPGSYRAVLTVTDKLGLDDSDSVTIRVSTVPMEATATADPTSGEAPLEVNFTGEASGGVAPYSFLWDFGDGTTSTAQNPTHTYTVGGRFRAILTVTDSSGKDDSDSVTIKVSVIPLQATATADPTSGEAPLEVNFTGEASGGSPPYTFAWDFGDGSTSTEQNPTHTYTSGGFYRAILTVTDNDGNDDSDSVTIRVKSGGRG